MDTQELNNIKREEAAKKSARKGKRLMWLSRTPSYVFVGIWSLFTVFVILWVGLSSLKSNMQIFKEPWMLPTELHFENFVKAWSVMRFSNLFS